jgi:hypothetical protein
MAEAWSLSWRLNDADLPEFLLVDFEEVDLDVASLLDSSWSVLLPAKLRHELDHWLHFSVSQKKPKEALLHRFQKCRCFIRITCNKKKIWFQLK